MDEGLAARRVADALGIELELVEVTPAELESARSFPPPSTTAFRSRTRARSPSRSSPSAPGECGVKVLLTGEGADELFGGYGKLHAAALAAFLPWYGRVVHAAEPTLCSDPKRCSIRWRAPQDA